MSAAFAPRRSSMMLMAIVDPCKKMDASAYRAPAFATPLLMPSTRCPGVESDLPSRSRPVLSSNAATSVNVPPISAARRIFASLRAGKVLYAALLGKLTSAEGQEAQARAGPAGRGDAPAREMDHARAGTRRLRRRGLLVRRRRSRRGRTGPRGPDPRIPARQVR